MVMPTLRRPLSRPTATVVCSDLRIPDKGAVANILPAVKTQLYSIPPWAASFGFSMLIAYLSDKFRHRFLFTIIPMLVAMAGFGILLNIHDTSQYHVQYGALFLVTSGCYSAMPVLVCWFAMNLGGHRRRSIGTAWQIGFGNSKHSPHAQPRPTSKLTLYSQLAESSPPTPSSPKTPPSTVLDTASVYPSWPFPPPCQFSTSSRCGTTTRNATVRSPRVASIRRPSRRKRKNCWVICRRRTVTLIDVFAYLLCLLAYEGMSD